MKFKERITAIIPAAGEGKRFGGETQKQFRMLLGKPVIAHTLALFQSCEAVNEIILIVPGSMQSYSSELVQEHGFTKVVEIVPGGERRQDSVYNGLQALMLHPADIVLVHDAVRPLITHRQIEEIIECCITYKAVVPAIQLKETVKQADAEGCFVSSTLDRRGLWLVQTPQAFAADLLFTAYQKALSEGYTATDDAGLVERVGIKVKIVKGSEWNIKITTAEDFMIAEAILKLRDGKREA